MVCVQQIPCTISILGSIPSRCIGDIQWSRPPPDELVMTSLKIVMTSLKTAVLVMTSLETDVISGEFIGDRCISDDIIGQTY